MTGSNFLKYLATVSGASTPVLQAVAPGSLPALTGALAGVVLDKFVADLSAAGYAKNGGFFLALAASTPVTVDLTAVSSSAGASAGDNTFAVVNEVIFCNPGAQDVVVSPGASNPFNGPLGGTAPAFTVPAGARLRWQSPAGWAVSAGAKTLKFDPGGAAASLGVCVGGA